MSPISLGRLEVLETGELRRTIVGWERNNRTNVLLIGQITTHGNKVVEDLTVPHGNDEIFPPSALAIINHGSREAAQSEVKDSSTSIGRICTFLVQCASDIDIARTLMRI